MIDKTKKNKLPKNFDWEVYLKLNRDLGTNCTKKQTIEHYLNYGCNEKREYFVSLPKDFNWRIYLLLNADLQEAFNNKSDSINHYIKFGYFENRKYTITIPEDFQWEEYINSNEDLKTHITTEESAIKHYLNFGFFENRIYAKRINPTLELNNLPSYYVNEKYNDNYEVYDSNLDYDELHEINILKTMQINNTDQNFLKYKVNEDILNKLNDFILVIDFFNGGGGTTFFLNSIISKYKKYQTFVILRNMDGEMHVNINEEYIIDKTYDLFESLDFLEEIKSRVHKIFINHFLGQNPKFMEILFSLNIPVVGITHDYYNLTKKYQPFYHELDYLVKNEKSIIDINKYDHIITQNIQNLYIFKKQYKKQISVVPLPDYLIGEKDKTMYHINNETNNKITVGILGNIIDIKGQKILEKIIHYYKNNKNIEIVVLGIVNINNFNNYFSYNSIEELNNLVQNKKINVLIELSLWPETYSYTLTLAMTMELPIMYLIKKFNSTINERLKYYSKSYSFNTIEELHILINRYKQNYFYKIQPVICYSKFWNDMFITKTSKNIIEATAFKHNIQPYFIYFPQFHNIHENNLLFYNGYNDIKNLDKYNNNNLIKLDELDTDYLEITNLKDYDLTNSNIIQKQINLINEYGYNGFAIYYYWFSVNNITNKHTIMEKVINMFFNDDIDTKDKKVFFIWANEDWTNNNAFGLHSKYKIQNEYTNDNFIENATNLIVYFKHANYLKIDNKPVFFIYHSYLIENIDEFYEILNDMCIKNGFSGVHLVLNSFIKKNDKYKNFYINFNYKKFDARYYDPQDNQLKIDYHNYIFNPHHINEKTIQTVVFDFNNRARLFIPNRLDLSTVCNDNGEIEKLLLCDKIIDTYNYEKTSEVDNILLINSFNEWGENMTFEPSKKLGYYNLNILTNKLID
jgi:hypothetical protein